MMEVRWLIGTIAFIFKDKETKSRESIKKLVHEYISDRRKNMLKTNREIYKLDRLLEKGEVDEETYQRIKEVLVKMKEKKEEEIDIFKYVLEKRKK